MLYDRHPRPRVYHIVRRDRRGAAASLDYILLIGVILPAAAFTMWAGPRLIRLTYEMVYVLISWPFM